ncbi:UDP-glucuronate:xylan alpha-glucuronosyltransferase 1 [Impatiens glandulifera]|uniref:UDP-glucuronate:xylan alpha-glucuronosyltransferase 1 n=1 Tax=Impatiens glandulifera TaxID=253017 RepID=UPI001FB16117|nr:UDP-glucuronate:xylan alpha-glucuronosyltransferase 1 [Impatiens glandulifera]
MCKRRSQKNKAAGAAERLFNIKGAKSRLDPLKFALAFIAFGAFFTLLFVSHLYTLQIHKRVRWIWGGANPNYKSDLELNWSEISHVLQSIPIREIKRIGILNFNKSEIGLLKQLIPNSEHIPLRLNHAKNITWNDLYPEWIDEEQEDQIPNCPSLPKIHIPNKSLDLIITKLPCIAEKNWSRDIARLHLQLATADILTKKKTSHVLFVTKCFPIPNLFTCKELITHKGNSWLYKPKIEILNEKLRLPIGSCELSQKDYAEISMGNRREAYATILHSADVYVCGAIAAAQSIRQVGSQRDLVILVDETISEYHKSGLMAAGWKVRTIERIRNPKAEKDAYNEWNYSKFRLWQLTDYDKIIFIDADLLILRNIDFLFSMPEISATGNNGTLFNSGVMVIEPSNCTFRLLMDHINEIESYNGGDQGYLNEVFTWWHRIPKHMNFLKNFWVGDSNEVKEKKTKLFGADPPILYVLHYLGMKPWLCYKDYDCNWNSKIMQEFASDEAHWKWWKVHDAMPRRLQGFCLLRSKQKAQMEWDRLQAEKESYEDGHWKKRNVKDPRSEICIDNLCDWKEMLKHWGENNWTDSDFFTPSPPVITIKSLVSVE